MTFPKDSAFSQEQERLEKWDGKADPANVLPTTPLQQKVAAVPIPDFELEEWNSLLGRVLSALEGGDLNNAVPLVELVQDNIYRYLH